MPENGQPELKPQADGFVLAGPVVFETVPALAERFPARATSAIAVDLQQITHADSAALALFLDWKRRAKAMGVPLRFTNWPEKLMSLVRLYRLESVLVEARVSAKAPAPSS